MHRENGTSERSEQGGLAACRSCGGSARFLFVKRGYRFAQCERCDCRYVAEDGISVSYDEGYFDGDSFGGYPDYLADRGLILENFSRRVAWLEPYAQGPRLLDVGAAFGLLVRAACDRGFEATGLEAAGRCASWGRSELGVPMIRSTVEAANIPPQSFDVVTLMDVLEHVASPREALQQVHRWLAPGGLVVIETGDYEALLPRVCGARWYYYDPPQHLTYFSLPSLTRLLRSCGFGEPLAVGHLGRRVSLKNFAFQLARSFDGSLLGRGLRWTSGTRAGRLTFEVPDRGNVFTVAARVAEAP